MDNYDCLLNIMKEYISTDGKVMVREKYALNKTDIAEIKKALLIDGRILYEDERSVLASVKNGFLNLNHCYIAANISENTLYIVASAEEGFIKQKTCKKAIKRILDRMQK